MPQPETVTIEQPSSAVVEAETAPVVHAARALTVATVEQHAAGLDVLKRIAGSERKVKEFFREPKEAAHRAHRSICDRESSLLKPLAEARLIVGGKLGTFEAEQRRRAAEEQRRLQEEARKREEERALQDAIAAEADGATEEAEAILEKPVIAPVIHVAPQIAKAEGVSARKTYRAEIVDKAALVAYVAAHPEWIGLLEANLPALNGLARSQRTALAIPGVRVVEEQGYAVRG